MQDSEKVPVSEITFCNIKSSSITGCVAHSDETIEISFLPPLDDTWELQKSSRKRREESSVLLCHQKH